MSSTALHAVPMYFNPLIKLSFSLAVLMMDDDTLVSAHDLTFAFSVWQVMFSTLAGSICELQLRLMALIRVVLYHSVLLLLFLN